jgi:hypothetical protein
VPGRLPLPLAGVAGELAKLFHGLLVRVHFLSSPISTEDGQWFSKGWIERRRKNCQADECTGGGMHTRKADFEHWIIKIFLTETLGWSQRKERSNQPLCNVIGWHSSNLKPSLVFPSL